MTARIRVCQVLNRFAVGGAETVALDLARSLDRDRFEVVVLAPLDPPEDPGSEMRRRFRAAGVATVGLGLRAWRRPTDLVRFWSFLRRGRFDILHAHNRFADLWCAKVGPRAGVGHCFWTRHLVYPDMSRRHLAAYRAAARRAPFVLAVSEAVRRHCIETEGLPARKVITVPNGIDTARFRPLDPAERGRKRAELGLAEDELALLFVGRLAEQKAPEAFLRLASALRDRGLPVQGLVCGQGPLAPEVEALAAERPDARRYLGLRGDVPELLGAADAFVSTSRNEGMPLNVMEAMAAAALVLGPDIPQVSHLLAEAGLAGQLLPAPPAEGEVPEALVQDWAGRLQARLADPARLAAGRAGRTFIESRYSLARMVARHEELYRSLCGPSPR